MAVRLDASGDDIDYQAGTVAEGLMTMMLWFVIVTDRNTFSNLLLCGEDGSSNTSPDASVDMFLGGDGTTIHINARNYNGTGIDGPNCVVGEPYHAAFTGSNAVSSAYSLLAYRASNGVLDTANGTTETLGTWPTGAAGHIQVGQLGDGVWLNGRIWGVKVWSGVALSAEQIAWERWFTYPVFEAASCYVAWPLLESGDNRDMSGNGRSPTLTGLANEDGLPMRLAPGRGRRVLSQGGGAPADGQPMIKRYSHIPHIAGRHSFARAA